MTNARSIPLEPYVNEGPKVRPGILRRMWCRAVHDTFVAEVVYEEDRIHSAWMRIRCVKCGREYYDGGSRV